MRFAPAHGLFEFENGLIGLSAQTPKALVEQRLHAFRDVVLFEKRARGCGLGGKKGGVRRYEV